MKRYDTTSGKPPDGFRLSFPAMLCQLRTTEGKRLQRLGIDTFRCKSMYPRMDGVSNTITTVLKDNLIIHLNNTDMRPEYKPNPTKDDLRDYFAPRVAVRKMVPKEAGRLMGLNDHEIELIQAYPFKSYDEKGRWEATATKKERNKMKRQMIAKTSQFKLFGNSIVVDVLFHLFRILFIPNQPENERKQIIQPSLFDL